MISRVGKRDCSRGQSPRRVIGAAVVDHNVAPDPFPGLHRDAVENPLDGQRGVIGGMTIWTLSIKGSPWLGATTNFRRTGRGRPAIPDVLLVASR